MAVRFSVKVIDHGVGLMLSMAPRYASTELNKMLRKVGTFFMTAFSRARLHGGAGIQVRKKRSGRRRGISIPPEARAMGFFGILKGTSAVQGKRLILGTTNRAVIVHEYGATIRPVGKKFLQVHVRTTADARKAGAPIGSMLFARRVRLPERLEFLSSWTRFQPEIDTALADGLTRMVDRIQRA